MSKNVAISNANATSELAKLTVGQPVTVATDALSGTFTVAAAGSFCARKNDELIEQELTEMKKFLEDAARDGKFYILDDYRPDARVTGAALTDADGNTVIFGYPTMSTFEIVIGPDSRPHLQPRVWEQYQLAS